MDTRPASEHARTGATTGRSGKLDLLTEIIWWTATIGIIFLAQARIVWFYFLFCDTFLNSFFDPSVLASNTDALSTVIAPVRGILFVSSFSILAYKLLSDIWRKPAGNDRTGMGRFVSQAAKALELLCLPFFPDRIDGLAQEYANSNLVFFTRTGTLNFHQGFLMPILEPK